MPTPEKGEKKQDYINRCTKYLIENENKKPDQARAQCEGMWNQHQKNQRQKKSEAGNMLQAILNETVWAMEPAALHQFMVQVQQNLIIKQDAVNQDMFLIMGDDDDEDDKPYKMEAGGIAVIEIRGRLIKRASGFFARLLGIKGMEDTGKAFKKALSDAEVKGIFLDIDSPGGSADGTFDMADIVFSGRGQKPILAFADGHMTSAAEAIGSAADYVVAANEITNLGSVGVYGVHFDYADRAKALGIKPTVFSAGKYKAIGNEFEHLSAADKKHIQGIFDHSHEQFINLMSRNLGIPVDKMDADLKEAKVFMGSQGIAVGLAHEIANRDRALSILRQVSEGKTTFEKHKASISMNQITLQGGVTDMANEQELTTKVQDLEKKLETAQKLIGEMTDNKMKAEFEAKIAGLEAEKTALAARITEIETSETALKDKVAGMEKIAADNAIFITAGKTSFDSARADIKKLSAQVDGEAYDEKLIDKQLSAFGNDMEALGSFKKNLESRRGKMFKTGELNPDAAAENAGQQRTPAQQYELGQKLVPKRLTVVK